MSRQLLGQCVLTLVLVGTAVSVSAQQTIFVVRHAERADTGTSAPTMATDPDLSETGHARARSLATVLKDAGIKAIFVTQYKRTRQTAEPLAAALGIQPTVVQARELPQLPEKLKSATGNNGKSLTEACAGELVLVPKLKTVRGGHVLYEDKRRRKAMPRRGD